MPNDNSTMESRFDERFEDSLYEDALEYSNCQHLYEEIRLFIQSEIDRAVERTEKAYGGCRKCYGKGYSTVKDYTTGHDDFVVGEGFVHENDPIRPCSCDRGRQITSLITNQS